MNSGKSTAVLQVAHNYEERGMKVLIIKSSLDTKGDKNIVSRLGVSRQVDILATPETSIAETIKELSDIKDIGCILVDEAQFLTATQVENLFEIAVKENVPVICYGIRTDFRTHLFPGSQRLMELAQTLEELKTICRCGKKAIFNGRKLGGDFIFEGEQVAIEGENEIEYESLCAHCYLKFKDKA